MAKKFYKESELVFREHPKSKKFIDITGRQYGRLLVLGFAENNSAGTKFWYCKCKCGNVSKIKGMSLVSGCTSSCGCLHIERAIGANITHGNARRRNFSPEYRTWQAMLQRTQNSKNEKFSIYGGRGITVCPRWQKFENFLADMGERPQGLTLDRKENDKGYYKENCRWATPKEQQNNKSNNRMITYNGETKTLSQWADILGIRSKILWKRIIGLKWDTDRAFNEPIMSL